MTGEYFSLKTLSQKNTSYLYPISSQTHPFLNTNKTHKKNKNISITQPTNYFSTYTHLLLLPLLI